MIDQDQFMIIRNPCNLPYHDDANALTKTPHRQQRESNGDSDMSYDQIKEGFWSNDLLSHMHRHVNSSMFDTNKYLPSIMKQNLLELLVIRGVRD